MYRIVRKLPWYLRLMLFIGIALPLIQTSIITQWFPDNPLVRIEVMTAYGVILWTFIAAAVGLDYFVGLVSTGFVMAVGTVVMGAAVRAALGLAGTTSLEKINISMHLFDMLMMLVLSIPLFGFAAHCFSASKLLERAGRSAGVKSVWQIYVAILLRVGQHFVDLFPILLTVWCEEHPSRIWPRCRDDWRSASWFMMPGKIVDWLAIAFWAWARCLLVFGLRVVPVVQSEATRYIRPDEMEAPTHA